MTNAHSPLDALSTESLLRMLADHSRDIIWHMKFPGELTYVSPACETILGWTPQEQMQRSGVVQMLTPESEAHAAKVMGDAVAQRATEVTYEAEHLRKDGSTVWCEIRASITYDNNGMPLWCIGVSRDVTEQRELRDRIIDSERRNTLSSLASALAHNLNNDLSVILGTLELLHDKQSNPLIDGALSAVTRAASMTRQLLDFGSHKPANPQILDLNTIVQNQLHTIRATLSEAVRLEFVSDPAPALIKCDRRQIEQVLFNLAINARDALLPNTSNPKVTIEVAQQQLRSRGLVVLSVKDNGPGMDEFTKGRAFEPFFSSKPHGFGLGLASAHNIAQQHEAIIRVADESSPGTTIELAFPRADGAAERSLDYDILAIPASNGNETIFLVEDESGVREVLRHALTRAGYMVHAFADGRAALNELTINQPDLLLTDVVMPGIDGRELAVEMRRRLPGLPVVFVSGYLAPKEPSPRQVLPGPVVTKPIYNTELLRTVRSSLQDAA